MRRTADRKAAGRARSRPTRAATRRKVSAGEGRASPRALRRANHQLTLKVRTLRDHERTVVRDRAEYVDLFDFAPVTYVLLDCNGIVCKANLAGSTLLNHARAHLVGHPLATFVAPQDRREFLEHLRRCCGATGVVESELRFAANGGAVTCRLYSRRASYQQRDVLPTVIVDQTERLALDQARLRAERERDQAERDVAVAKSASAAKDEFLAAVSHELRTPLTPALFAASRLARWERLPDQATHLADTIKRNIEFEARLIDDLLDLARINGDRFDLRLETADLHAIVEEAIRICRPLADANQVVIDARLIAAAHFVSGDRARLRQVFWNLLNNAVKFSDSGGRIVVASANPSDGRVMVSIRDSGVGMDATIVEHLFAPFDRRPRRRESRAGLGLGLAICKGIIGAHGGHIAATSDGPGRGSTFAVELAAVEGSDAVSPEARHGAGEANRASNDAPGRRVLVIEDDPDSREMLSMFLSHHGYSVAVAPSLRDGLARLAEGWDIVLSDLGLPDGSGLEIARHARRLSRTPRRLIAFTGYGAAHDVRATREAGFDDHIVKPVDPERLLETLKKTLNPIA